MPAAGPDGLERLWRRYWAERVRGGARPREEGAARDAFYAGAGSALVRAKHTTRERAWREFLRGMKAEHIAEAARAHGLRPIEGGPTNAKGWMAS